MIASAEEYPKTILPQSHWDAIFDSCAGLIELGLGNRKDLKVFLPGQFEHLYDEDFLERFLFCVIIVYYKLRSDRWYQLACVGEELALEAVIEQAKGLFEDSQEKLDEDAFNTFKDVAFEDLDFELLYSQRMDGIENDPELSAQMGFAHLHPSEWFLPFREEEPVHPFIKRRGEFPKGPSRA